ncbi:hypothetical protein [Arenibacter amylolyticus]|nr:hypothetical protein [Arenibacter amylolyticus]
MKIKRNPLPHRKGSRVEKVQGLYIAANPSRCIEVASLGVLVY